MLRDADDGPGLNRNRIGIQWASEALCMSPHRDALGDAGEIPLLGLRDLKGCPKPLLRVDGVQGRG